MKLVKFLTITKEGDIYQSDEIPILSKEAWNKTTVLAFDADENKFVRCLNETSVCPLGA